MIGIIRRYFREVVDVGLKNEVSRHRWVQSKLEAIPAGAKILDAGAGECQYKVFCSHLEYVSQDFSQYEGVGDGSGLQTKSWDVSQIDIVSDITSIPVGDGEFDAILCTEVFEHIPDPGLAVKEFSRLLKADGIVIITAPFLSFTHFAPYHFATGFNRYYYLYHLAQHGFGDIEITSNGNYFEFLGQELRRLSSMGRQYGGRRSGVMLKAATAVLLFAINRMSKRDSGSDEVVAFGLHVTARKK